MRPPDGGSNPGHADPFLLYFHAHAFDPPYRCPSIDQEGRTITRDAATPVELAAACQAALDTKAKKEQELDAELKAVAAEKAKLGEAHGQLSPMLARIRTAVEQLAGLRPQELAVHSFPTDRKSVCRERVYYFGVCSLLIVEMQMDGKI